MPNLPLACLVVTALTALGAGPGSPAGAGRAASPLEDCNRNGIEDAVDIAFGTSSDEDHNGVPDECEAAPALDRPRRGSGGE